MTLLFYVNNQTLSQSQSQRSTKVVADSKNYLKARFIFQTAEWNQGRLLYALFTYKGKTYKKILGAEEGAEWNECFVSPEVIKPGEFFVSVYAEDLITTNTVQVPVSPSGYTEKIENQPATPSVMEQMNQLMYKYANLCNQMYKACKEIKDSMEVK